MHFLVDYLKKYDNLSPCHLMISFSVIVFADPNPHSICLSCWVLGKILHPALPVGVRVVRTDSDAESSLDKLFPMIYTIKSPKTQERRLRRENKRRGMMRNQQQKKGRWGIIRLGEQLEANQETTRDSWC